MTYILLNSYSKNIEIKNIKIDMNHIKTHVYVICVKIQRKNRYTILNKWMHNSYI